MRGRKVRRQDLPVLHKGTRRGSSFCAGHGVYVRLVGVDEKVVKGAVDPIALLPRPFI